jgi:CubicO group peptidase (beta-lactamase class C family)
MGRASGLRRQPVITWLLVVTARRWNGWAPSAAAALLVLAWLLVVRSAPANGVPPDPSFSAVDHYLRTQVDAAQVPGVAVAVVEDGHVVFARGYGQASAHSPMTADTPVVIGSTSKSITAVAVLQLVEQGRIDLNAPIGRYLPWYAPSDPRALAITVRDLLIDTSGIPTWAGWSALGGDGRAETSAIRALVNGIALTSPPGARFQYSNANYIILGQIIEAVTGQRYADVVEQSIFGPLGMTNTHAADSEESTPNRYWFGTPLPSHLPYLEIGIPAGAITSSANDLARYLEAQLGDNPVQGSAPVLSAASLELSHVPAVKAQGFGVAPGRHYGMGWYTGTVAGEPAIVHSGDVFDSSSSLVMLPARRIGIVVVATTSSTITPTANTLGEGVASALVGRSPPDFSRSLALGTVAIVVLGAAILAFAIIRTRRLVISPPTVDARLVTVDVLVPVIVTVGLPLVFSRLLDRAETISPIRFWVLVMRGVPDLGLLILMALLLRLGSATVVLGRRFIRQRSRHLPTQLQPAEAPDAADLTGGPAADHSGAMDAVHG